MSFSWLLSLSEGEDKRIWLHFEMLMALLLCSYGLVRRGLGLANTKSFGVGRGWVFRAPLLQTCGVAARFPWGGDVALKLLFHEKIPLGGPCSCPKVL